MEKKHYLWAALAALVAVILVWAPWKPAVAPTEEGAEVATTTPIEVPTTEEEVGDNSAGAPAAGASMPSGAPQVTRSSPATAGTRYKEFVNPAGYINTNAIAPRANSSVIYLSDFVGKKIILLDFYSYATPESVRGLPFIKQYWTRYRDKGFMVIGIHAPEFAFEADQTNVRTAAQKADLAYPIIIDSFKNTWNAYGTKSAPRRILIDLDGRIAYDKSGESSYPELEKKIQDLIFAASARLGNPTNVYQAAIVPPGAWTKGKTTTPDLYLGSAKNSGALGNLLAGKEGPQDAAQVAENKANLVYVTGSWNVTKEYLENRIGGATLSVRYGASRVQAVLGHQKMVRVKVTLDGQPLGERAGKDITVEKGESILYVSEERLYDILADGAGYGEHTLELAIDGTALQLYKLIFG